MVAALAASGSWCLNLVWLCGLRIKYVCLAYMTVFLEAGLASICSSGPIPQLSPPSSTTLVSPGLFCLVSLKSSLRGGTDLVHCRNERTPHHCPSSDPTGLGQKTELMLGCSSKQELHRSLWSHHWWMVGTACNQSWARASYAALQVLAHVQQAQVKVEFCSDFKIKE